MTELRYRSGKASVEASGTVVTFSSAFMTQYAQAGDDLRIADRPTIKVVSVVSDGQLEIEPWPYASAALADYALWMTSPLRSAKGPIAIATTRLANALNASGYYYYVAPELDVPPDSEGDDGQWARQEASGKEWLKQDGFWIYKGVFRLFTERGEWTAATTYTAREIVRRVGKLWTSKADANTNHPPETSAAWWEVFLSGGDAYDVVTFDTDRPAEAELVLKLVFTHSVSFYSGLVGSRAKAEAAATAQAVYSYRKNGTQFATLTFAANSANGVFASSADTTFAPGDILTVIAPQTKDATLSGIGATLSGYRTD